MVAPESAEPPFLMARVASTISIALKTGDAADCVPGNWLNRPCGRAASGPAQTRGGPLALARGRADLRHHDAAVRGPWRVPDMLCTAAPDASTPLTGMVRMDVCVDERLSFALRGSGCSLIDAAHRCNRLAWKSRRETCDGGRSSQVLAARPDGRSRRSDSGTRIVALSVPRP
jgi:hypothetical protein